MDLIRNYLLRQSHLPENGKQVLAHFKFYFNRKHGLPVNTIDDKMLDNMLKANEQPWRK
jgi:hypothetical protein